MKIYVQTDIEGVAGLTFFENMADQSFENAQHRQRMRRLLTREVNAAVTAAFESGAAEVVVNDSHGSGYNILFEELDPRCEIIHGRNCSGPHWLPEFDKTYDALVLVGMHAMAGTANAIVSHSLWEVNDGAIYLSEASMAAALAGVRGVPTVFASGDDKICAELRDKIPSIHSVAVKKGLGAYQARSLMPARACELIAQGVREAIKGRARIAPYRIPGPLRLNLLDSPTHVPPFKRVMEQSVVADDMETAFTRAVRQFPWNKFDTSLPDGFKYP
ncbi:MAG: M55 family metallopeptidase [Kiritimatiellae bacterium]|nr:M55 family metallopeptidase [Kiritimatiellia bacterium]